MQSSDALKWAQYLELVLNAIIEGRIEAKTLKDMTPEQKEEYLSRLWAEEKDAIADAYSRHDEEPID